VAQPDRVPGFIVEGGRAIGHDLPSVDGRESLVPWRTAIGGRGPFFVRIAADDPAVVKHVQRLSRVGELWLETPLGSIDDALDLVVAGASRLAVPTADRDADLLEAVGPSALIAWDGVTPWAEVEAAALAHEAPVLVRQTPPPGAACDVFLLEEGPEGLRLVRVASAPAAAALPTPAVEGEAE
jgi:hypothetical protein